LNRQLSHITVAGTSNLLISWPFAGRATHIAALRNHSALVPGETGIVLCIAPDQNQADIVLDYTEANFRQSPILNQLIDSRTSRSLRLTNQIEIEVRASDFRLSWPIGTGCARSSCVTWNGRKSSSIARPPCTCGAPRMASGQPIQFAATNCAPCASSSARQTAAMFLRTERRTPFTTDAVNRLVKRIGERASFSFKIHVHMLRHACGYALANQGHDTRAIQDWLGHRAIQHTARYTELSQERFKDFWRT
jgi:hypothetical protein